MNFFIEFNFFYSLACSRKRLNNKHLILIQSQHPFRLVILTYPCHYNKAFAFLNFLYPLIDIYLHK